jgi:hypothetical protein
MVPGFETVFSSAVDHIVNANPVLCFKRSDIGIDVNIA